MNMLPKIPEDLLYLIRTLDTKLERSFRKRLEEVGLSAVQGRMLINITRAYDAGNPITQKGLVVMYSLSKSTTSELIGRMVKKELIRIEKVKNKNLLIPTEKGLSLIISVRNSRENTVKQLEQNLTEEDKKVLQKLLIILNKNMEGGIDNVEEN